ncbi:MAG: thiolase domain-containing protein [Halobacteriales archaeon]|nr:thiolase domain-containing protein [Halobacteriales archaeon]
MQVALVGAGQTKYGTSATGLKGMFAEAARAALASVDKGMQARQVQEAWIGSVSFGGAQLGNLAGLLVEHAGMQGIPARRVENACASGGFAFRDAVQAVKSGSCDVALAAGIERMNDQHEERQRYWLGVSGDTEWERTAGLTFSGVYALMAARHMKDFGTTKEHLAHVAVKNHANGALNPKAQFQKPVSLEDAMNAPSVAAPLGLYDCCSTTDGAAAALVVRGDLAQHFTDTPIWVQGSGASTDLLAIHDRPNLTELRASRAAGQHALREAGCAVRDLGVAEVHDCFTIAELLALEDLGFCAKGQGGPFTASGATKRDGQVAVNTSGGLKAKGHPLGATGIGQVCELFLQLRGQAGPRQRAGAERGLAHNVGGSGATCAVHVLGV